MRLLEFFVYKQDSEFKLLALYTDDKGKEFSFRLDKSADTINGMIAVLLSSDTFLQTISHEGYSEQGFFVINHNKSIDTVTLSREQFEEIARRNGVSVI